MFWFMHANTRKYVSEQSWFSGWVFLNILAHLAHLDQSYFSLIFNAINTYNCFWFDLTIKFQLLKMKAWWKMTNAYNFFPYGDSRHYWYFKYQVCKMKLKRLNTFLQFRLLFHEPHCIYRPQYENLTISAGVL